jgi:hypothetical protein
MLVANPYTSTITSSSLRLRESRTIADLLLKQVDDREWKRQVKELNVLQMGSPVSVDRISLLLRARLEPLGPSLWQMVRDGDRILATQAAFAGAVKDSRLLGDFLDIAVREQRQLYAEKLPLRIWSDYIAGCRGRDPEMPSWSDATVSKLRSAVFSMLAEAGYVNDTRELRLQNVFVTPQLADYLRERDETYVLRCLEVSEG